MSDAPHTDRLVRDMALAHRIADKYINKYGPMATADVATAFVATAFFAEICATRRRNLSAYNDLHKENS